MLKSDLKALKAGDIYISDLVLVTDSGVEISLIDIFSEIDIYENIFENETSGVVFVVDALNLVGKLPITGNERIRIRFISPGRSRFYENEFQVYSVNDRLLTKEAEQVYSLRFSSLMTVTNKVTSLNKSYSAPSSEIIKDIFKLAFNNVNSHYPQSIRAKVQDTEFNMRCIIPGWRPLDAINWVANKTYAMQGKNQVTVPDFIFYQNQEGFQFRSLTSLAQAAPSLKYIRGYSNINEGRNIDINREMRIVSNISFEGTSSNKLKSIEMGLNSSSMILIDPIRQTAVKKTFSYQDFFDSTSHMYPNSLERRVPDASGISLSNTIGGQDYIFNRPSSNYSGQESDGNYHLQRKSILESYDSTKIQITVPGDSDRTVGEVVYLSLPSPQQQSQEEEEDPMSSGKYIISALRHSITRKSYSLVQTVSRDCFLNGIPDVATFN